MQSRIVLISDDSDFFEYVSSKLILRKTDELFRFGFDELPEKLHLLQTAVLIINSENAEEKTLELLNLLKRGVSIVFSYNDDGHFKISALKEGAIAFITPLTSDDELLAKLTSALNIASVLEKNVQYRQILVRKNLIMKNNEVLLDYNAILDCELEKIKDTVSTSVLVAISPNEKTKFLVQPNQIETIILNNIRKNDILMNYATNKYFLLLRDIDIDNAMKLWSNIQKNIPEKIYAGFVKIFSKTRQQLVNEALNKLHEAINYDRIYSETDDIRSDSGRTNFKMYKKQFNKDFEQIVSPVFYHIRQKYSDKLFGVILEHESSEGCIVMHAKGKHAAADFKMTCPGLSKINIDITFRTSDNNIDAKRISLNPEELESGLLEDLLEQFISEFKKEVCDG